MNRTFLILLISILALSCQTNQKKKIEKEKVNLNGNWEYLGFGKAIVIGDSIVKSYHTSTVGNVQTSDNSSSDFFKYYTVDTLSKNSILLKDGVKTFELFRSDKDFAKNVNDSLANDPKYNFEVLWNTFNEQYVYFEEREMDWTKIYEKYEPQVKSEIKPLELYLIFEKMLGELNDGHVSINLPDEIEEDYEKQLESNETETDEELSYDLVKKVKNKITETYLKDVNLYNRGDLKWGMINEDIAYLQTSNMIGWANYPIADSLSKKQFWDEWWNYLNKADNHHDDVANGTRYIMDSIVKTIGNAKACIIDLRFNGGGFDDVSVEILNHFISKKTDICTKKVRQGEKFTEKQKMSLIPSENNFEGNLYILTSHETASAAELLVLGSKEIPNSKIIGSTTEGVFSDILHKKLPNGWTYGLSNMVYESLDGISYEEIGITPDYELNYPAKSKDFYEYLYADLKDGDDAIEKVINLIKAE
jgi:hypothetical protein